MMNRYYNVLDHPAKLVNFYQTTPENYRNYKSNKEGEFESTFIRQEDETSFNI